MKKLLIAAVAAVVIAPAANASGYVQPHVPPAVIIEDTAASGQGILVPALAVLFVWVALFH